MCDELLLQAEQEEELKFCTDMNQQKIKIVMQGNRNNSMKCRQKSVEIIPIKYDTLF